MYLVGQEYNKELIDNGKLDNSNFIIIIGPRNYGKTYLTKYLAKHFNLNYMLLDNKVSTIRGLVAASNRNNESLYHFKDFEKASPAAKASLLKIAEETPKGLKIVLTTSSYNLLDTLLSRAYILHIQPYSQSNINDYVDKLSFNMKLLEALQTELGVELTPSKLYNYNSYPELEEITKFALDSVSKINKGLSLEDISKISNNFWKDDGNKTLLFLDFIESGISKNSKKYYKKIKAIEQTKSIIKNISISNYRQAINNMLMEMV